MKSGVAIGVPGCVLWTERTCRMAAWERELKQAAYESGEWYGRRHEVKHTSWSREDDTNEGYTAMVLAVIVQDLDRQPQ